ncbi:MAG: hypothetical protein JOZ27_09285, partial [Caulobacteraceae bacterium]|nr:hypothetical protein [Caulobacteraceae bacterium]
MAAIQPKHWSPPTARRMLAAGARCDRPPSGDANVSTSGKGCIMKIGLKSALAAGVSLSVIGASAAWGQSTEVAAADTTNPNTSVSAMLGEVIVTATR